MGGQHSATADGGSEAVWFSSIDSAVGRVARRLVDADPPDLFCAQLETRAAVLAGAAEILGTMFRQLAQFEQGLAWRAVRPDQRYLLHKTVQRIVDTAVSNAGVVLLELIGERGGDDTGRLCCLFNELVRASQSQPPDLMRGAATPLPGPSVLARTTCMAISHDLMRYCAGDRGSDVAEQLEYSRARARKLRQKARKSFAKLNHKLAPPEPQPHGEVDEWDDGAPTKGQAML